VTLRPLTIVVRLDTLLLPPPPPMVVLEEYDEKLELPPPPPPAERPTETRIQRVSAINSSIDAHRQTVIQRCKSCES
jgi:hypothetical protein